MALPDSRNTTYAAGSQVKSADLNDVQDKIVDLHVGKRSHTYSLRVSVTGGRGVGTFADGGYEASAGETLKVPIPVDAGERIASVSARVAGQPSFGTGTVTLDVRKCEDGGSASLGTADSGTSGDPETVQVAALDEDVDGGNATYEAWFTFAGGAPMYAYSLEVSFEPVP